MDGSPQPPELVLMYPCGCGCGIPVCFLAEQLGQPVLCPHLGRGMHVLGSVFGAAQWETTARVGDLEACAEFLGISLSPRTLRLAVCHWSRGQPEQTTNEWDRAALIEGEAWAETGVKPKGVDLLLERRNAEQRGGYHAHFCIEEIPRLAASDHFGQSKVPPSDAYRDVTPNPFVPLTWNPEWLTSTVRDMAGHIYESRDFSAMPILGDALMDAGCDHQLIQDHCRTTKPHARGCWVVDAILGKS